MRATVSKTFRFEAAHQLLNHDGKCSRPHGHSYKVAVRVRGSINRTSGHPKEGMVIDFADIKEAWKKIEPMLDHQDLNQTLGGIVTTAENIAIWIGSQFNLAGIGIEEVELWETETSSVRVTNGDLLRG